MRPHSSPTSAPIRGANVVTEVLDQLNGALLLQLAGAVVVPQGTIVELADGTCARVESLRLIAPRHDAEPARLITHVAPVFDSRPGRSR